MPLRLLIVLAGGSLSGFLALALSDGFHVHFALIVVLSTYGLSARVNGTIFSPLSLFCTGFLVPACVSQIVDDSRWRLTNATWLVVLGAHFAFALGHLLIVMTCGVSARRDQRVFEAWENTYFVRVIWALFVVGMLGFAANMAHVVFSVGLDAYWKLGLRNVEFVFASSTLTNYLYFTNMLVFVLILMYFATYGFKLLFAFMAGCSFVALFFHGIRGTIIFPAVVATYAMIYLSMRIKAVHLVALSLVVLLAFCVVSYGRIVYSDTKPSGRQVLSLALEKVVTYIVPNYANLQMDLQNRTQFHYGLETLAPIVKLVTLGRYFPKNVGDWNLVDPAYRAGTYFRDYYMDFGLAGAFVISFLMGVVSTWIHHRSTQKPRVFGVLLASTVGTMVTFSFWYNEWFRIQFWYILVLCWVCDRFAPKRMVPIGGASCPISRRRSKASDCHGDMNES